jgi:tRNA(Ile)-lysidine synthase TilS/MesJ
VLAHHAEDQVETFLWQLVRGTGSQGFGMTPVRTLEKLTIHRPWLGLWSKEIAAYAAIEKLHWHQDPSNRDTTLTRNRLRLKILPYLRQHLSPHVDTALWRAAEIQRAEQAWLDQLTRPHARAARLAVKTLQRKSLGPVRRIVKQWLQQQGIADVSFDNVEAVRGLLEKNKPAKVNLSQNRHVRRQAGWLFVE